MAQALLLALFYMVFIVIDIKRMKKEGKKKPIVLYCLFMAFCFGLTMLISFDVELIDPQKAIVDLMKNLGVS